LKNLISICLVIAVLAPLFSCTKETEEDRVKKVVTSVQKAAEEKKIKTIQEHLSKAYRDPGGHDYEGIKGLLAFYFFRHKTVSVYLSGLEVVVNGPQATARFQTLLTAKGVDGEEASVLLPDALGAYDFEVAFRKEEKDWKIVSSTWQRAMEGGAVIAK
jgi:ketosteroid isomerase-like protein